MGAFVLPINFASNTGIVEKRRAPRAPLGIKAAIRERGRTASDVTVSTFSAYGCQIDGFIPTCREGQAWLKLSGLESQMVSVIWNNGTTAGVEFDRSLHPTVAARYLPMAGSHAAIYAASHPSANDHLLSRREQIVAGISGSEISPLQRRKKPTGLGISGKINRAFERKADHRYELRYGDNLDQHPGQVMIDNSAGSICNVSSSGLRAIMPKALNHQIGEEVPVQFEGFEPILGRVVWMNQTELGISLPPQSIDLFDSGND
jgi:hypothetical protein